MSVFSWIFTNISDSERLISFFFLHCTVSGQLNNNKKPHFKTGTTCPKIKQFLDTVPLSFAEVHQGSKLRSWPQSNMVAMKFMKSWILMNSLFLRVHERSWTVSQLIHFEELGFSSWMFMNSSFSTVLRALLCSVYFISMFVIINRCLNRWHLLMLHSCL